MRRDGRDTSEADTLIPPEIKSAQDQSQKALDQYEQTGEVYLLDEAICVWEAIGQQYLAELPPEARRVALHGEGIARLRRHDEFGQEGDLRQALEVLGQAVGIESPNDPSRALGQKDLGRAMRKRFLAGRDPDDLDQALHLCRNALNLMPPEGEDTAECFRELALALHDAYDLKGDEQILGQALETYRSALAACPPGSKWYGEHLKGVATAYRDLYLRHRRTSDLEEAISLLNDARSRLMPTQPVLRATLNNLALSLADRDATHLDDRAWGEAMAAWQDAIVLSPEESPDVCKFRRIAANSSLTRYERLGRIEDLERSIGLQATALSAVDSPDLPMQLYDLGMSIYRRYDRLGQLEDLTQAIRQWEHALALIPVDSADRSSRLFFLGLALQQRYEKLRQLDDLDRAIGLFDAARKVMTRQSPGLPVLLRQFGEALSSRYERSGELEDLGRAARLLEEALELARADSPQRPFLLHSLGHILTRRYERQHSLEDLENAIRQWEEALTLAAADSPLLHGLSQAIMRRYERLGELEDLERATRLLEEALELLPANATDRLHVLFSLGSVLARRFERWHQLEDLERAIDLEEQSLRLATADVPEWPFMLFSLGSALKIRHSKLKSLRDLDRAIDLEEQALALTSTDSPERPPVLLGLGDALADHYDRTGSPEDLTRAIELFEEAMAMIPADSPTRPILLNKLGSILKRQYERFGRWEDLEQSISHWEEALELAPVDSPIYPILLQNTSQVLTYQYDRQGKSKDLERSIGLLERALSLTPTDSPNRPILYHDLGAALHRRYERQGKLEDLARAINQWELTLAATSADSPARHKLLHGLGSALITLYNQLWRPQGLDRAIGLLQEALALISTNSRDRIRGLHSLGIAFHLRYERLRRLEDLDRSIGFWGEALTITPVDAPDRMFLSYCLGNALTSRHERLGQPEDLDQAISSFREASAGCSFLATVAIQAPLAWLKFAISRAAWSEAVEAVGFGRKSFRQLWEAQDLLTDKQSWLGQIKEFGVLSAYILAKSDPAQGSHEAMLALEESRAVLLIESLQNRQATLDELARANHELASRYRSAVEDISRIDSLADVSHPFNKSAGVFKGLNALRQELRGTLDAIRHVSGYERFLTPPVWEDIDALLQRLPDAGCLVYLAVTPVGSMALIAGRDSVIEPIWMDFKEKDLDLLLWESDGKNLESNRNYLRGMLDGDDPQQPFFRERLVTVLSKLGERVMGPLAKSLERNKIKDVALIPCGALTLLPLHAAVCGTDGNRFCFMDAFRTRYSPNARVLREALIEVERRTGNSAMLGVANPLPANPPLGFARCELEEIENQFKRLHPEANHVALYEEAARKESLRDSISKFGYLHMSTHGIFDPSDPLASRLLLADGECLNLRELMESEYSPKEARLVVLGACQSALTDFIKMPGEYIGLPAGFLQAGVPGVVAMLWPVNDLSMALLLNLFYDNILEHKLEPAEALRQAQIWLRDATCKQLEEFYKSHPAINNARKAALESVARGPGPGAAFGQHPWYMPEMEDSGLQPFKDHPEHWAVPVFVGL